LLLVVAEQEATTPVLVDHHLAQESEVVIPLLVSYQIVMVVAVVVVTNLTHLV
tara:strand:- start:498 stop:656 length:159 start_codon:yes stop_codon:yes gene_type:complete